MTVTGAAVVQISTSFRPLALPPVAGVSVKRIFPVVTGAAALNVFQAAGSAVRFRFSRPAMLWKLPPASALTLSRYGAGPKILIALTLRGDSNAACTEETPKATCCVVVSRSNRSGALAASCAWTSGGRLGEENTVSANGVAFEPAGSVCPVGKTEAYTSSATPAADNAPRIPIPAARPTRGHPPLIPTVPLACCRTLVSGFFW